MGIMDIAKKISGAKTTGGGNYLNPGRGVLIVKALKFGGVDDGFQEGDTFVAEMQVESNEPFPGLKDENGRDKPNGGNTPGSSVSYICQFDKHKLTAFGNAKNFVLKLLGETEESLGAEAAVIKARKLAEGTLKPGEDYGPDEHFMSSFVALVGKTQPARGMRIKFSTYEKATKAGKLLTLASFETVTQTPQQIEEARAKLGAA